MSQSDDMIGKRLATYQIQQLLGRGGMASVYYADDVNLKRPVAIKMIDTRFQGDPEYARRFVDEARMVASWRNENIIQVYYAGIEEDIYFFAMEYIEGMGLDNLLADYLSGGELMSSQDVIQIGRAVANALDYAHTKGVIHRDVKPSNVMISTDDRVVLTDFGLALDTAQGTMGQIFGTPHYISPEQARSSADVVSQSDLYSFGVMLFEMLTGVVPFDDPSATTLALQHLSIPPPNPRSLNPALNEQTEEVLLKILEKDPADRYQTGQELMDALEAALNAPQPDLDASSLPLPPAAVSAQAGQSKRPVSRMSVAEKVAVHLQNQPPKPRKPQTQSGKKGGQKTRTRQAGAKQPAKQDGGRGLLMGGIVGVLLIALVAIFFLMSGGDDDEPEVATITPQDVAANVAASATDEPLPTDVVPSDTAEVVLASATAEPASTEVPPSPIPQATATQIIPTATQIIPTATQIILTATQVMPTQTPVPVVVEPTVLYPAGRLIQLFYDETSFYVHNTTNESIRVGPLDFQSLDGNGNTLPYAFDGGLWTQFFPSVERGKCEGIEISKQTGWMKPSQCGDYNSIINPSPGDEMIFWTARDGQVAKFRVLFNGQEVAQCGVSAGVCEARLP